jgi:O-antigen/teichoic acid export membrane protein
LPHNGVDIDQYILLTIYPIVAFFAIAILGKKFRVDEALKYFFQGISCILFAVFYLILIPRGGAQGLAIILILFGILLFFMARKQKISPKDQTQ